MEVIFMDTVCKMSGFLNQIDICMNKGRNADAHTPFYSDL